MHMADALLSPLVGGTMAAVSAGAVGYAAHRLKQEQFSAHSVPLMGVMGAFVFAAQMVNFTIPGTGSSGHIGGGILLSAVLGGPAALLTLTAVLIIQCLFFADGGLLALGCNIFNMGVLPCLLVYPLVFAPLTKKGFTKGRLAAASIAAAVLALQLGAFAVVLETLASGITALPFSLFVLAMQPIHLAIGLVEGVVTGAVLYFVNGMEPDILRAAREHRAAGADAGKAGRRRWAATLCVLLVCAGLTAGGLSLLASQNPDGLEWSIARVMGSTELAPGENAVHGAAAAVQDATAILPDYDDGTGTGTAKAGLVGGALTLALAAAAGGIAAFARRRTRAENGEKNRAPQAAQTCAAAASKAQPGAESAALSQAADGVKNPAEKEETGP